MPGPSGGSRANTVGARGSYPCAGFDVLTVSDVTETLATLFGHAAGTVAEPIRSDPSPMRWVLGSDGVSRCDFGIQIIVKII